MRLTEGSILKSILYLGIPVFIANLLQTAYNLIDTFWVGRLGTEAVAAVSLTFPVIFLIITFSGGIGLAGAVLVAQYKGSENSRMVNHSSAQSLLLALLLSLIAGIIGYFLTPHLVQFLGAESNVIPLAVQYMRISFLGIIFVFGFLVYQSLSRAIGDATIPLYIVLFTVILNIFLDPLFIFGYKIIPAMGVSGAAMATLVTQAIALLIGMFVFFKCEKGICLNLNDFKPDKRIIKKLVKLGIPTSLEQSSRSIGFLIITAIAASFGTITLAAYGIGMRIITIIIIPAVSISIVSSTLVGQNIGARKIERAKQITKTTMIFGFLILTLIGILFFVFSDSLSEIFIKDPEVISQASQLIKIFSLSFGFTGLLMTFYGTFRGAGNPKLTMIIAWTILFFQIAIAIILSRFLNETGIWIAMPVSNIIGVIIGFYIYMKMDWNKSRIIEASS
jgi:putative MATE family efflux protein